MTKNWNLTKNRNFDENRNFEQKNPNNFFRTGPIYGPANRYRDWKFSCQTFDKIVTLFSFKKSNILIGLENESRDWSNYISKVNFNFSTSSRLNFRARRRFRSFRNFQKIGKFGNWLSRGMVRTLQNDGTLDR